MRIKAVTNLGTNDYPEALCMKEGDEANVSAEVGAVMLARGHAVAIDPEPITPEPGADHEPVVAMVLDEPEEPTDIIEQPVVVETTPATTENEPTSLADSSSKGN